MLLKTQVSTYIFLKKEYVLCPCKQGGSKFGVSKIIMSKNIFNKINYYVLFLPKVVVLLV